MTEILSEHFTQVKTSFAQPLEAKGGQSPQTLVTILGSHVKQNPDKTAFTFISADKVETETLSFGQLQLNAQTLAARLQHSINPGDRVLLVYSPCLDFVVALFASWMLRAIAVPLSPELFRKDQNSLNKLVTDITPSYILCNALVEKYQQGLPDVARLNTTLVTGEKTAYKLKIRQPQGDDIAILQYTSGSTSAPKGVKISHENVMVNSEMIKIAMQHNEHSTFCGWAPFYHDQGLIGNLIQPIYIGATCILMSPQSFIRDPLIWLETIAKYKVHTSGGPNFAFELCNAKYKEKRATKLDLSSWKVAFNGAEPIQNSTLDQFTEKYSAHGFRSESFYPCYGLAEATLLVTGGSLTKPPVKKLVSLAALRSNTVALLEEPGDDAAYIIGCGQVLKNEYIKIIDPDTGAVCSSNQIGEICVAGANVSDGYWGLDKDKATWFYQNKTLYGADNYLRTGDLGVIDQDSELFILARIKELIVKYGKNIQPLDIELTVASIDNSLDPSKGVAFSVDSFGQNDIIVVHEIQRAYIKTADIKKLSLSIRKQVQLEFGVTLKKVYLCPPNTVRFTTSGKKRRQYMKEQHLKGLINHYA